MIVRRKLHMRERRSIQHAIGIIWAVSLLTLSLSCTSRNSGASKPLPSFANPPIYPGALNVEVENLPSGNKEPARHITFDAPDEPAKVLDFYKGLLLKEGWMVRKNEDDPDGLYFLGGSGITYSFSVGTKTISKDRTTVELYLYSTLGQ